MSNPVSNQTHSKTGENRTPPKPIPKIDLSKVTNAAQNAFKKTINL